MVQLPAVLSITRTNRGDGEDFAKIIVQIIGVPKMEVHVSLVDFAAALLGVAERPCSIEARKPKG